MTDNRDPQQAARNRLPEESQPRHTPGPREDERVNRAETEKGSAERLRERQPPRQRPVSRQKIDRGRTPRRSLTHSR